VLGGPGIEPGDQAALGVLDQRPHDRLDLLGRLALAEDDLGEAAARPPLQVDVGESAGLDEPLRADPPRGVRRGDRPGRHGFQQLG
jgi:hypothetical protein